MAELPASEIDFWSGNRTSFRRDFERDVLVAALQATRDDFGDCRLFEHPEDYPGDRESAVFREFGHDLFVTTAGNRKMADVKKIVIYQPILNDLLGYRSLIIRERDMTKFAGINSKQSLKEQLVGIPESWSDAELFRYNGFKVVERGSFDDMFERLHNREFDFTALGINEIDRVFAERADEVKGLATVDHILIYYPLPLLFYVNPDSPELAERIEKGMKIISADNTMYRIFFYHNRDILEKLNLSGRKIVRLKNPILPERIAHLEGNLS
ncbi:MAG: hypothetical protein R6U28_04150 [Cyclonatronaceae bacterium]